MRLRSRAAAFVLGIGALSCGVPAQRPVASSRPVPAKALLLDQAEPRGGAPASPVMGALQVELTRAMAAFAARPDPPVHFLSYQVEDERGLYAIASFGALVSSREQRERQFQLDLRAGEPKLDSTHPLRDEGYFEYLSRWPDPVALPIEDDLPALRALVWLQTEDRYRSATERLARLRAERRVKVAEEDTSDDFSVEQPATYLESPASIELGRAPWETRIRAHSALFRQHPEIHESSVSVHLRATTRYFVSSEGTTLQTGRTHARLSISASTRADDGMELHRNENFDASQAAGLPDDAEIERVIRTVIDDVIALRRAPVTEPWSGPAILEGRAAGVFFHEVFGHRIEGHRQKIEDEGQTFAKKIGQQIMPDFVSVFDDPRIARLNGVELNGTYLFDDEGIPAQRASLVEAGVLRTFLMSRSPVRGFAKSNGHGRREIGVAAVARQANLVIDPSTQVTTAELKQKLLAEVARQKKPYGLRFREIEGGYTHTERDGPQAFKVLPILVYRVYPDGKEELVRGVDLEGTPLTSLSRILAAGDDFTVFNGVCGAESGRVPVAAASPSLLVEQIEIARKEKDQDRPPVLGPPPVESPKK